VEVVVSAGTDRWNGTSVLLTGHTGFKGGWLAAWLHEMGARVHGYALEPDGSPALFDVARVDRSLASDVRADVRDAARLVAAFEAARPAVVFHLAAQPIVRASYADPLGTFATNVQGTANVLEAARRTPSVRAIVVVTTDKVYENREWPYPYREVDPLGGRDPYSASKAAAEIVAASYRASFFAPDGPHGGRVATARAGNVIGGGDWAADRLVPDCLRAFAAGTTVTLRNPGSVRPWQHVLEPLAGYVALAEALLGDDGARFADAWNFGPDAHGDATVGRVAEYAARAWGRDARVEHDRAGEHPHEAGILRLDSGRARRELGWTPRLSLEDAVERTVAWHKAWHARQDMRAHVRAEIEAYRAFTAGDARRS
jgi:CDP-glucose 4,6-dehydratase